MSEGLIRLTSLSSESKPVTQIAIIETTDCGSSCDLECNRNSNPCELNSNDCNTKSNECNQKSNECKIIQKCDKDPCRSGYDLGYGWGWFGALVLWFIIFTVLFWLIYYSLKPSFVLQSDSNQVDTAKVLLAAVISALILVIIIWLIKLAVNRP